MKKTYTISIDKPCNEDWNKMTEIEKGRFCSVCSKAVSDFTNTSDADLIKIIKVNKSLSCGRFTSLQINRPLVAAQQNKGRALFSRLLSGLLLLATGEQLIAQDLPSKTEIVSPMDVLHEKENKENSNQVLPIDTLERWIHGQVFDAKNKVPKQGVEIQISGYGNIFLTDSDGRFTIKIPYGCRSTEVILSFYLSGYQGIVAYIPQNRLQISHEIYLKEAQMCFSSGLIAIYPPPKKWWQFWK